MPLTKEQFQKARDSGFTTDQIIEFEKRRASEQPKLITKGENFTNFLGALSQNVTNRLPGVGFSPPKEVQAEMSGLPLEAANMASAGLLRPAMRSVGMDIPEQQTLTGKVGRGVGAGMGFMAGFPGRAVGATAGLVGKALGQRLAKSMLGKIIQGSASGAVGGALSGDTMEGRKGNAMLGAAIGGAAPIVSSGAKAVWNAPKKYLRGGLSKAEVETVKNTYGSSTGTLEQGAKEKLQQTIKGKGSDYGKVFDKAPEGKFINIKPSIDEAGTRLERLGLITKNGNLTEFGKSEIAQDSVYGKLLDYYQSAKAISGVEKYVGKPLTGGQMAKAMDAERQTLVNKDQYLLLRDKLNALWKNKGSDKDVGKVIGKFYQSGEDSGLTGLQDARRAERIAFLKEKRFLTPQGDLKIATERNLAKIGTKNPPTTKDLKYIKDLEEYINSPIISEAEKINRYNQSQKFLESLKGPAAGAAATAGGIGSLGWLIRKLAKDER